MMLESTRMSDKKDKTDRSDSGYPSFMWHGPGSAVFRKSEKVANSDDGKSRGEVAEISIVVGKLLIGGVALSCGDADRAAKERERKRMERRLGLMFGGKQPRSGFGTDDFD